MGLLLSRCLSLFEELFLRCNSSLSSEILLWTCSDLSLESPLP
uniref:U11/U12 small nuclear ribonucleoprotein 35 kDa protein n=1 Tax=Rhizophora mucronata TaxID=61149 RepID=A0A2P2IYB3_RHIMU